MGSSCVFFLCRISIYVAGWHSNDDLTCDDLSVSDGQILDMMTLPTHIHLTILRLIHRYGLSQPVLNTKWCGIVLLLKQSTYFELASNMN